MKLLYGTTNASKLNNMIRRLEGTGIEVLSPSDLNISIDIVEDGITAEENAIKKARAYYEMTQMPTFAGDTAVYINEFPDDKQPGLSARRINGHYMTDEEMIEYYAGEVAKLGGQCTGYYVTGIALIVDEELESFTIKEPDFMFVSQRDCKNKHRGNPLDVITVDLMFNKYWSEMTKEEWKVRDSMFDTQVRDIIVKALSKTKC